MLDKTYFKFELNDKLLHYYAKFGMTFIIILEILSNERS